MGINFSTFEQEFLFWSALVVGAVVFDVLVVAVKLILRFVKRRRTGFKTSKVEINDVDQTAAAKLDEFNKKAPHTLQFSRFPFVKQVEEKKKKGKNKKKQFSTAEEKKEYERKCVGKLCRFLVCCSWLWASILVIDVSLYQLDKLLDPKPEVIWTYPASLGHLDTYEKPIEFEFSKPVDMDKLEIHFEPQLEGEWEYHTYADFTSLGRRMKFYPSRSLEPDERIMIYLAYISNPRHPKAGQEFLLEFYSPTLPQVTATEPEADSVDVLTDAEIIFDLDGENGSHVAWEAKIEPGVEFTVEKLTDQVKLVPTGELAQSTVYDVQLLRAPVIYDLATNEVMEQGESEQVSNFSFTTVKAPLVASFSPSGSGVFGDSEIVIEFDDAMDTASVGENLVITPGLEGELLWDADARTAKYEHSGLAKETRYEFKFGQGTHNAKGGVITEDVVFAFETIGAVTIIGASPANNASYVGTTAAISVTFDQPVEQNSAEAAFSISPSVDGYFSWSGNKMTFSPSGSYGFQASYTYTVGAGIKSIYGLDSRAGLSYSFTTAPQRYELSVPMHYQGRVGDEAWSCNIVAATMLLAYRNVSISTAQLRSEIGYQQALNVTAGTGGNPHKGFVPGYGTYWEAVSAGVSRYRSTRFLPSGDLTALLQEVQAGNPVMIWGQNGWTTPTPYSWTATDGTPITGVSGMHSIVVRGFVGTPENPTSILVNDPWRGATTLTPAKFKSNWSYFNVAMVVN